jgi:site-specific recombinase XerD
MELIPLPTTNVLLQAEVLITHAVTSSESQRAYRRAIRDLIDWCERRGEKEFDKAVVYRYRSYLVSQGRAPATINQKLAAVRALAVELADGAMLSPIVAAAISRVRGVKSHGIRMGRWLTQSDAQRLIDAPNHTTLRGKRDRALIAVSVGCGLRRSEIAQLRVESIQQRSERWVLLDIRGKHGRNPVGSNGALGQGVGRRVGVRCEYYGWIRFPCYR